VTDLWEVLGYNDVAAGIATTLAGSTDLVVIEGPPGVGKSGLASGVGLMWEASGGVSAVAQGDLLRGDVPLDPFGSLARLPARWRTLLPAATNAAKVGESLLGTFGLITSAVQTISSLRNRKRRERAVLLDDAEHRILHELELLSGNKPLLLIADNLHWWDASSLAFLARIREPRLVEEVPFLGLLRVIATQTVEPYQSVLHSAPHRTLLSPTRTRTFVLGRIPRDRFARVLATMGIDPPVSDDVVAELHSFSGGNLALAKQCADRIAAGDSTLVLGAADPDDFVGRVLSERIRHLGPTGEEAVALLQVAAVLGLTFRRGEVVCAVDQEPTHTARLLRYCRDEGMLEIDDDVCRFVHEIFRRHFLDTGAPSRADIHERLDRCLRTLRPSEYELRCVNAKNAEHVRDAGVLAVHAGLQQERDGGRWIGRGRPLGEAIEAAGLADVATALSAALRHLNAYRFAQCVATLDRLPQRLLTRSLAAESDYIRAMCLMSMRSEVDRAQGRSILEGWAGFEKEEPEIGLRLMLLLLYGYTHLPDKSAGLEQERRIKHALLDRTSFDPAARDAFSILDRSAGSLNSPDVAVVRTAEAVRHFEPTDEGAVVRRPLEFYRCLVNYGANLICTARYHEAVEVHDRLSRLVEQYAPETFPRTDYPAMNAVLSRYRAGDMAPNDAVRAQRAIVNTAPSGDQFYAKNALAVYLALAGSADDAIVLFDELETELHGTRRAPEPSMVYLIGANRAASRWVTGETERARYEWDALAGTLEQVAYVTRDYLLRRHELLRAAMDDAPTTGASWDVVLTSSGRIEFGPLWDNYGRGFRMPEVEFWREN
jgi:hypothetical protein